MNNKEEWKPYPEDNNYLISTSGNVFSKYTNKILKLSKDRYGYMYIHLSGNICKKKKVHRLVAETYIQNPKNKREVNHINGIKTDNSVSNLEWVTTQENLIHMFRVLNKDGKLHQKLSELRKGKTYNKESYIRGGNNRRYNKNGRAIQVKCVETGIIYQSAKEAAEKTGARLAGIYEIISGCKRTKTSGGYHWIRID